MERNICLFTGARPNFMKMAPLIKAMNKTEGCHYELVYAGTDRDATLESSLFADLQIERPSVFLGVDSDNLNELTGHVMAEFERYLEHRQVDTVVVVDDLASTMAAAIVAKKRGLRLAHLVAGTRSFNINMPKEINRLVIDGLSDLLFTAGVVSSSIETREGAEYHKIYMVGNILMDTLRMNQNRWRKPACVNDDRYIMFTLNRKALLADEAHLYGMLDAICHASGGVRLIAPLRGKAKELVERHGGFKVIAPLPYLEFGWLLSHAAGVVTDSGNVAEEATFHHVPCITLNSYTEHIETVKVGTNVLVGEDVGKLQSAMADMVGGHWKESSLPDRWDGRTAERIVKILMEDLPSE